MADYAPDRKDTPLSVEVTDGELVIRCGINVVAFSADHMEANNPFDDDLNDFKRLWAITDPLVFANEVRRALMDEEEDGTTPLIALLDRACLAAIEDGAEGVKGLDDDAGEKPHAE